MTNRWITTVAAGALAWALVAAPARAATPWLAERIDQALQSGVDAKISPNLSLVLGLAKSDEATPVKQFVYREGSHVRTFNVCAADHKKIVLLTVDEQTRTTTAFLISPKGNLRKAVSYTAGAASALLASDAAQLALRPELEFWSQHHP